MTRPQTTRWGSAEDRAPFGDHVAVAVVATAVNACIVSAVLWNVAPKRSLVVWLGAVLLVCLVRFALLYAPPFRFPSETEGRFSRVALAGAGVAGVLWGMAPLALFPAGSVLHQVFMAFVLGGMVAGAAGVYGVDLRAFLLYSVPAMLPIVVRFAFLGTPISLVMAGMLAFFWVLMFVTALRISQTSAVRQSNLRLTQEVKRRIRVEDALRKSERRNRAIVTDMPAMICRFLPDGTLTFANEAYASCFGRTPDALIGKNFFQFIPEHELDRVREHLSSLTPEAPTTTYTHEALADGGQKAYQQWTDRGLFGEDGQPVEFQSIGRDVTQQKKVEEEFRQTEKLEAMGTLVGGIAHDFNNLLQAVIGNADLLLENLSPDDTGYQELTQIHQAGQKGASLTRNLLAFGHPSNGTSTDLSLNDEVMQMSQVFEHALPETIQVHLKLAETLPLIHADAAQISQLLMNLAINATEAMPDGGRLTFETKAVDLDNEYCEASLELRPGSHVRLRVTDTGYGIPPEIIEHVFEPFYTTKGRASHHGLGLTAVYGIMRRLHGQVTCKSVSGHGTILELHFPVTSQATSPPEEAQPRLPLGTGAETILVVDDEPYVRTLAQKTLTRHGYTVLCADSGESALSVYRDRPTEIDLVILDIIMPGMGGTACLRELVAIDPSVKVVVASGYEPEHRDTGPLNQAKAFISKPYRLHDLLHRIRDVLDSDTESN